MLIFKSVFAKGRNVFVNTIRVHFKNAFLESIAVRLLFFKSKIT